MNSNWNHTTMDSVVRTPVRTAQSDTINDRFESIDETKSKKKCHGNKRLQRFRQRRRARGMSTAAIEKTIEARKREKEKQDNKKRPQQHQYQVTTDRLPVSRLAME